MEVHPRVNSALAKKLWNVVKVTFYMIRKGLVSKRKLMMDLNLMMKRGKLLRKSVSNLMSQHLHHHHHSSSHHYPMARVGLQEYEFSCSNSPNPVFFHVHNKRKHHYFPCINLPQVNEFEEEEDVHYRNEDVALVPKTPEYTFNLPTESIVSPFSVRVSNYSSEEESNREGGNVQVDREAEEFIERFYEQLRHQSGMQLFQYQ